MNLFQNARGLIGYLHNLSNETISCIWGGTNNLYEVFFHIFWVTMNKHSENGRKEKQQLGSGKGNTFSGSINKLIKAEAWAQALAWDSVAPSRISTLCQAWRGPGPDPNTQRVRANLICQVRQLSSGFSWVTLPAVKLRELATACFIYY